MRCYLGNSTLLIYRDRPERTSEREADRQIDRERERNTLITIVI